VGNLGAMRIPVGLVLLLGWGMAATRAWAGGSGLNVIVVVNQNSTNSVQLGNDYCELRGVPPQNLFRMTNWTGGSVDWGTDQFQSALLNPLLGMIAARGLTTQAQFVVLSMDIPYRVGDGTSSNSTTSALFYGFKPYVAPPVPCLPPACSLPDAASNSYAFSEMPFEDAPPDTAATNAFLTMMLTASNLTTAEGILRRGVASDSTFPTQTVYLEQTSDPARNVRFVEFDNAIMDTRIRGDNSLVWIVSDTTSYTNLLGLLTGLANLSLPVNAFVSGAIGDSLTSYAGMLFENSGQTSLLAFLNAGASGSYGTIQEPCNYLQKFPNPLDYFYQDRGFCLAEAYYQSVLDPFQGLMAGEPLSAPFARRGASDWSTLSDATVLSGTVTLSPAFAAAATNLPLGRVDLFVDGTFSRTVTNLPPSEGNVMSVTLNGFTVDYSVPAGASVASAASGLADALNAQTNATQVLALDAGDRIELQSLSLTAPGSSVSLSAGTSAGTAGQLTTWLSPARPTFLDTSATGYLGVLVSNSPAAGDWVELTFTKTNGAQVVVAVTNTTSGTSVAEFTQGLVNAVNATTALQGPDGALASDFADDTYCGQIAAQFTLYARSPGLAASQLEVTIASSANLVVTPSGTSRLQDNINDLRPRNHLYVSSGAFSLPAGFVLDTTQFADGWHELTAVAYEGTSVRTQMPVSHNVQFRNTSLSASFAALLAGTNATVAMPLRFSVAASTGGISSIELFSTGGAIGVVSNEQTAVFTAPSALLGLGLHPFYAVVTDTAGDRYQTQTLWIRLVPSFTLSISRSPLELSWAAIPGQSYEVLATTNITAPFEPVATVVASNSVAQWPITAPGGGVAFYRVQLGP